MVALLIFWSKRTFSFKVKKNEELKSFGEFLNHSTINRTFSIMVEVNGFELFIETEITKVEIDLCS